jgi:hypothetical protein
MANAVGLNMKITADTAGIGRGINRTEKMLGSLQRSTNKATSALRTLAGIEIGRLAVSGITSIVRSLNNAARSAVRYASGLAQSIDETAKLAQRTGIAVESLQALQVAASLAGVGNIETALQKVTVAIGNAAESGKTDAFEKLGLDFALLETLSPEEQFRKIAAAIQALPTEAERAAAAVKIFGRSGVELLPLFASNLEEIEARAKRLGIVLSEDQTGAIEDMNDALSLVRQTFDGIIGQVTANLAPVITELAEQFLKFVEGFQGIDGDVGGDALADAITEAFFDGADYVAKILDPWINKLIEWGNNYSSVTENLGGVFEYFGVAIDLLQGVFFSARAIFNTFIIAFAEVLQRAASLLNRAALARSLRDFQIDLAKKVVEDAKQARESFAGRPRGNQAGEQRAADFVRGQRERFNSRNTPEAIAKREAERNERLFNRLSGQFAASVARAAEAFGDNVPQQVAVAAERLNQLIQEAYSDKKITEEEIKGIQAAQAAYNTAIKEGQAALKEAEKTARRKEELEKRLAEKSLDIESKRLDDLSRLNNQALNIQDLRSGGISQVFASMREDPAIEEYRKQLSELKRIRQEIAGLGIVAQI